MGFLDSLKTWLRTESADAKDLLGDTKSRMESDLDRREGELAASPAERLEQMQAQIADDDSFGSLRDKIEGRAAKADAVEELADTPDADEDADIDEAIEDADVVAETPPPGPADDDAGTTDEPDDGPDGTTSH
ncbi:MAG: hypothetical protein AAFO29_09545 [Actinomycetota bacterium]